MITLEDASIRKMEHFTAKKGGRQICTIIYALPTNVIVYKGSRVSKNFKASIARTHVGKVLDPQKRHPQIHGQKEVSKPKFQSM